MKKLICTLSLLLLGTSFSAMAGQFDCVPLNGKTPRIIDLPEPANDITLHCCQGLNTVEGYCKDTSLVDPTLKSCSKINQADDCPSGEGCYTMGMNDMFLDDPEKHGDLSSQISANGGELKENDSSCLRSAECKSSNCERPTSGWTFKPGKCTSKLICRKAADGEPAPGNIECKDGLNKDINTNKCAFTEVYPGVDENFQANTVEGKQCQWEMDPEQMAFARGALNKKAALRALLANIPPKAQVFDGLHLNSYLAGLGRAMEQREKIALAEYNKALVKLEADKKSLEQAIKEKDSNPNKVITFDGKTTTNSALVMEISVGGPALSLQLRSNAMRGAYEQAQLAIGRELASKLMALYQELQLIKPFDKEWSIGGSRYKIKRGDAPFFTPYLFASDAYQKLIIGGGGWYNTNIMENKPTITNILQNINPYGDIGKTFIRNKTSSWFGLVKGTNSIRYLVEPLINYPALGFVRVGILPVRGLAGSSRPDSYEGLLDQAGLNLDLFNISLAQDGIAVEPEIFKRTEMHCFKERLSPKGTPWDHPGCPDYNENLKQIREYYFGYLLSLSISSQPTQSRVFTGWFMSTFANWIANLQNLDHYYDGMGKYRANINDCITKVLTGVSDNYDGTGTGITPGTSESNLNYGTGGTNYQGGAPTTVSGGQTKPNLASAPKNFNSSLNSLSSSISNTLGALSKGGNMTVIESTNTGLGGTNFNLSEASSMAARDRLKTMKEANAKAAKSGLNVAGMDKAVKDSMKKSINRPSGSNSALDGFTSNGSGQNQGDISGSKSTLDEMNSTAAIKDPEVSPNSSQVTEGVKLANPFSGNSNNPTSEQSGNVNSTGMSAEEQQAILENAKRNNSKLQVDEFDSLFNIISKAYKRNLDHVLEGTKEIE